MLNQDDKAITPEMQAVAALRKMRARLEALEHRRTEPLAIVGTGCRIPGGVVNLETYWDLLRSGRHSVRKVPRDRWDPDMYFHPDPKAPGKTYTCWGGFIDGIDEFDAPFFGISAAEARRMSPPQRIFLEVAWEALEDAGISPKSLACTRTGVFVGATTNDYLQLHSKVESEEEIDAYLFTNNTLNVIAGRVSYTLGLQGPSLAIDTACSSSLVAIDRACRSLRDRETDLVIAGGVNANITPDIYISASKWGMLAHDGRCKAFDAAADGFVRGEGCGALVLKRLADAQAAGDRIVAVIRGTAVNQDGPSSGLSVPNGLAQEAVIREALANAGVDPADVSYVEAHGTGTSLGDPIEVEALGRAMAEKSTRAVPLAIGSVKTNIGHLEAASGVAGVLKVVAALEHRAIPPHLHLQRLSEHIAWESYAIEVPTRLQPWTPINGKRIAGVSGFGFSGTNAHIVLEEAPAVPARKTAVERPCHLLTISAKTEEALSAQVHAYRQRLEAADEDELADLCYTANVGRAHFGHRIAVAGGDRHELAARLASGEGVAHGQLGAQHYQRVALLFTGQGSQYIGMGRELYDGSMRFREVLDTCDALLRGKLPRGLLEVMFGADDNLLEQTAYTQPALFALEYALAEIWRSWGVQPAALLGHSVGEYVAACIAGVYSLEEGLGLIAERGRLMQAEPAGGAMAAVFADEVRVRAAIEPFERLSIAAVNGPANVVISGDESQVEAVREKLAHSQIDSRRLRVSHAFHSARMDPVLGPLEAVARQVRMQPPTLRLISNLTGKLAGAEIADPGYWALHTRQPVQFARGMEALRELGCEAMLEIGPAPVLVGMGQKCLGRDGRQWLASLRKGSSEWKQMSASVQALYAAGLDIDWAGWDAEYGRRKAAMPTYRFQRQRYWIGGSREKPPSRQDTYLHPLVGVECATPLAARQYEAQVSRVRTAWLQDFRVGGRVAMPAAAFIEMGRAAGRELWPGSACELESLALPEPLFFDDEEARLVVTTVEALLDGEARCRIYTRNGKTGRNWTLHANAQLRRHEKPVAPNELNQADAFSLQHGNAIQPDQFYAGLGSDRGECSRGIRHLWRTENELLAEIRLADRLAPQVGQYLLHPALLQSALDSASALFESGQVYLPTEIRSIQFDGSPVAAFYCHAVLVRLDDERSTVDLTFYSESGQRIGKALGVQFNRVDPRHFCSQESLDDLYGIEWRPAARQPSLEIPPQAGGWLIFADSGGTGQALANALESRGQHCSVVLAANLSDDLETVRTILRDALAHPALHGVLYLGGMDTPSSQEMTTERLGEFEQRTCCHVLRIVQGIAAERPPSLPRLWLVTRGAQGGVTDAAPSGLAGAPILGFGKAIAIEHRELRCVRVDLDPAGNAADVQELLDEIYSPDREDQIAFRNGTRFVPRVVRVSTPMPDNSGTEGQQMRLEVEQPGLLNSLQLRPVARRAPRPGEVEIRVRAIGLNFRDVLTALGLYPGAALALGSECAGSIERVGPGVANWKPGDEVIAFAPGEFGTFALTRAEFVTRRPLGIAWAEAATIPVAFLTGAYGLQHLAKLAKGQTVLIHAAAGGVGLAAVQLAQSAGADVYATAGSEEKRAYLRSLGLTHVMDSRSLGFAAQVRTSTGGRGVDVVLNSLAGDFVRESFAIVAPGGHFVELGKQGILRSDEAASLRPDVHYHACDLNCAFLAQPELARSLFAELMPAFESRRLHPLPLTTFRLAAAAQAFRHMAAARHIGKVVLLPQQTASAIRPDGAYLITGGLGELGFQTARWLVARGARHIALVGRSAPAGQALAALEDLRRSGANVRFLAGDISSPEQTREIFAEIRDSMPPLRGIVHAASVFANQTLATLRWDGCAPVFAAKVNGAWNLHRQTLGTELDFFVLFSSAAVLLGASAQANYVAANSFLDSLALLRHSQGLPALAVDWGCWAPSPESPLNQDSAMRLASLGITPLIPSEALGKLEILLARSVPHAALIALNWQTFLCAPYDSPVFDVVRPQCQTVQPQKDNPVERMKKAAASQRRPLLVEHVSRCAAQVLGLDANYRIDELQPLRELGADSLLSVELRNQLGESLGRSLPATLLFDYPTVSTLATYLAGLLGFADQAPPEDRRSDKAMAAVAAMSDAEAEAVLLRELSGEESRIDHD